MDVTCNRCGTTYEFEAALIAPAGTTVKCTECGHLFKVLRPSLPAVSSDESASWQRSWRVRQADGTLHVIESLAEVIRLVGAGHFGPDDEISRTGQVWKRLGTIAELAPLFAPAERARRHTDPRAANASEGSPADPPASPARDRRRSPREHEIASEMESARARRPSPVVELGAPRRQSAALRAAIEQRSSAPPSSTPPADIPAPDAPSVRPRWRRYVGSLAVAGALLATGSVAAVMLVPSSRRPNSAAIAETRIAQLLAQADHALASHRPSGFELAIQGYERALELDADDPRSLGGLSRAHAIWSQWLRFRLGPPERTDALLASETAELREQARQHADAAQRYAQRAVQLAPARGSVGIAWSDALRLEGDLAAAREALDRARTDADAPRADVLRVAALLAIDEAGGDTSAGRALAEQAVAADPSLLRTRFLLLQCLIGASAFDAARVQLRSLQQLDPTHPSLPAIAAQLETAGQPEHGLKRRDAAGQRRDKSTSQPREAALAAQRVLTASIVDARAWAGY